MSVTTESLGNHVIEMVVTVEAERFSAAVQQAVRKLSPKTDIPGFRQEDENKPRKLVEAVVGTEALYDEAIQGILIGAYKEALQESGYEAAADPENLTILQAEDGKELIFKTKVAVKPDAILGQYKGLEVEKSAAAVTPEQVEEDLLQLQHRRANLFILQEGTVESDDKATIDFEGFVDGEALDGGKAANYELIIGSNSFIPGFEEQLTGAQIGQETEIQVQFPDDYHSEDWRGKKALFKIFVHQVMRKDLTPLDDEFATKFSDFATLDELRADLYAKRLQRTEQQVENACRNALVKKAVDNAAVEFPKAMVQKYTLQLFQQFGQSIRAQGMEPDDYLRVMNTTKEAIVEQMKPKAEQTVKTELVLRQIAKLENIVVSDADFDAEVQKLSEEYKQSPASILMTMGEGGQEEFRQGMRNDRVVALLETTAIVTTPAPAAPAPAATATTTD